MAVAVGFALAWMVVPTVGTRVVLLAVSAILTVMLCMTTAAATVKKAALGRKKRPPLAVQKQLLIDDHPNSPKGRELIGNPSLALPKVREFTLAAFVEVVVALISLGEGWAGVSLGWLVTYVTWSRINCYVLTCLMSRALVSNVTSQRGCPRGCRDALA